MPPTFANQLVLAHMASFNKSHPEALLSLEIGSSKDLASGFQDGKFDLGLIGVEPTKAGVKLMPFRKSLAACVMPCGHPLADRRIIRPADLHGESLISFNYRHARRAQLDKLLLEARAEPIITVEVSSSIAAIELVRMGVDLAVVNPFPSVLAPPDDVVFRPFSSAITYQTYFAVPDHKPLTRTARHFMRHIRLHTPKDSFSEAL